MASTGTAVIHQLRPHLLLRVNPVKPASWCLNPLTLPKAAVVVDQATLVDKVPQATTTTQAAIFIRIHLMDLREENTSAKCVLKLER